MTLSECRSKSQFNVFEKWDQKNSDDQLTLIFIETVSTIQNFLSRKVGLHGRPIWDGLLGTVVRLDGPYFNFRAEIFHCPNEEIYGRKGSKWILVVQGRHMHEILQKEKRFEKCRL